MPRIRYNQAGNRVKCMNIKIDEKSNIPIYLQLMNEIKNKVIDCEMVEGQSLPSIRTMANMLGIHRNTVSKAYSELEAEGYIECRQGIGCFAKNPLHTESRGRKVNWVSQISDEYLDMEIMFDDLFMRFKKDDIISMGSGISLPDVFDENKIAEIFAEIVADENNLQNMHCPYKGDKTLRRNLVHFLEKKDIKTSIGNLQVMPGINQALDFIIALLVQKNDIVLMEEPASPDLRRLLKLAGAKIRTIPVDKEGICCDVLEKMVKQLNPKLIFISSGFNSTTGARLSFERAKKLIEISKKYRLPIVEQDEASELVFRGEKPVSLKAMDLEENVIYIYSFHLTFVPGIPMAFVVAHKEFTKRLSYLVSVRMIYVNRIFQKLIAKFLEKGSYYDSLDIYKERYCRNQDIVCNFLDNLGKVGIEYERPDGGVYLWCKLPEGLDSKKFINIAYGHGITLVPGNVFYSHSKKGRNYIRLCYSFENEKRLKEGMQIFENIVLEECGKLEKK